MINNRCLNDMFAYCKGGEVPGEMPLDISQGLGNGCTKDVATCGHYLKEPKVSKQLIAQPKKEKVADDK